MHRSQRNQGLRLAHGAHDSIEAVVEIGEWYEEMVALLRQLNGTLSDSVESWDRFLEKDVGYFQDDEPSPIASTRALLRESVNAVDRAFSNLKDILRKLRKLEAELCQDSPRGVSYL
jgi:hypothetical protein